MITKEERTNLINSIADLLAAYDYNYTVQALGEIVDKWAEQKAMLIKGFKKHPNYVDGKFMIALTSNVERMVNKDGSSDFSSWLYRNALERIDLIPKEIKDRRGGCFYLPNELWNFLSNLYKYAERCVSEMTADVIKRAIPEVRVHVGEKTSRAVNRICTYLGYNKIDGYNKAFAKYADSLSPTVIKRRTILSVNPLDYLTMSFGNSWASCHTIDKSNRRGADNHYNGAYSTGTISYMLDTSSMVFYTVSDSYDGNEFWSQPKINRQMFHWGEEKLIQSRLYPQSNDICSDEYKTYRNVVQEIISTAFDFPNLWTLKTGTENASRFVCSLGTHYRDYEYFDNCSLSRIKGSENDNHVTVGHNPMCVRCGKEHDIYDNIDHCIYVFCEHCGRIISEGHAININGHRYCSSCVHYCEKCNKQHVGNETYIHSELIYVCDDCLNEHYVRCNDCRRYVSKENAQEVDGETYCVRCARAKKRKYRSAWFDISDNLVTFKCKNGIFYRANDDDEWIEWF